jgi:hypothetical protein
MTDRKQGPFDIGDPFLMSLVASVLVPVAIVVVGLVLGARKLKRRVADAI